MGGLAWVLFDWDLSHLRACAASVASILPLVAVGRVSAYLNKSLFFWLGREDQTNVPDVDCIIIAPNYVRRGVCSSVVAIRQPDRRVLLTSVCSKSDYFKTHFSVRCAHCRVHIVDCV